VFAALLLAFSFALSAVRSGQAAQPAPTAITPSAILGAPPIEYLTVRILSVRPQDTSAYMQGLLLHEGSFYQSTGLYGESTLREVDPLTGEVLRKLPLEAAYFAEGLALVGDKLIQITWKEGVAFVYDLQTFEKVGEFQYSGEGWGLCYDGVQLYMSDGSPNIYTRDPQTFALTGAIRVTRDGVPVEELNELECVGDDIYANVWFTDEIVRIDKATGRVKAVIDARGLLTREEKERAGYWATLNGIAYDAESGHFLITGKQWPWLFEVEFVARLEPSYRTPTPLAP
jgi:glutamine cyclotransferase